MKQQDEIEDVWGEVSTLRVREVRTHTNALERWVIAAIYTAASVLAAFNGLLSVSIICALAAAVAVVCLKDVEEE